ncbi:DUF6789 family protein [Halorarius halobius]|uniref:DUF6789 family protein n=1 Tax=Halorarius halobius TaxID=2962671 RepID=UPI0020CE39F0|nr:DUF6789 family protein [Halorarius halobius]
MSTETRRETGIETGEDAWRGGVVAGIAGAVVMSVLMLAMGATNIIAGAIPGLYTLAPPPTPAVGLFVHISHGAVLGVVFAGIVEAADLQEPRTVVAAGVGYGAVTWLLLAALVMPLWLSAVGFPAAPPFPNFAVPSLLWHVVYGVVTGAVFVAARDL